MTSLDDCIHEVLKFAIQFHFTKEDHRTKIKLLKAVEKYIDKVAELGYDLTAKFKEGVINESEND